MSDSQEFCYELPYGIFGILNWSLLAFTAFLNFLCPVKEILGHEQLSKWFSKRDSLTIIVAVSTIIQLVSVVSAIDKCRGALYMILVSFGQLSSTGFTIIHYSFAYENDAYNDLEVKKKILYHLGFNDNKAIEEKVWARGVKNFGKILVILSSISGWIGTTGLLIYARKTISNLVLVVCVIHIAAILLFLCNSCCAVCFTSIYKTIRCCCPCPGCCVDYSREVFDRSNSIGARCDVLVLYFLTTLHVVEACVLISFITVFHDSRPISEIKDLTTKNDFGSRMPTRTTKPFFTINTFEHVAEISSWINHGFVLQTFWDTCHGHVSTIVIMKVERTKEFLGVYNPLAWNTNNSNTGYLREY
ncbi:hypothetical protein Glove_141g27 [Diversispora epigaea]|uniref:TLDc domain-containing protein n=1 Tax=Diversispora epigaea TaxID=1348612 RepID=A0A397IYU4_9GLOM|nr:hypothetical protein Glove_141g27 [Diversispora epigaea]